MQYYYDIQNNQHEYGIPTIQNLADLKKVYIDKFNIT